MPFTHYLNKVEAHDIKDIGFCLKVENFLHDYNIKTYKIIEIDTDASKRHYYRIITSTKSYILMDSSAELESLKAFLNIANFLIKNSLNPPKIYSQNLEMGFTLLEDLGNDSYTKFLESHPDKELELYLLAIDVLIKISKLEIDITLQEHNEELLNQGISVFIEWYVAKKLTTLETNVVSREIYKIFNDLYKKLRKLNKVLILRDYHADNLMWLPQNSGLTKVGILDFQDAVLGSPVYDLVSLLEDARRDLKPETVEQCKHKFYSSFNTINKENLNDSYAILAIQRNLRIVGVFHRLRLRDGKIKYASYLSRVWGHIKYNLEYPLLKPIREIMNKYKLYEF